MLALRLGVVEQAEGKEARRELLGEEGTRGRGYGAVAGIFEAAL